MSKGGRISRTRALIDNQAAVRAGELATVIERPHPPHHLDDEQLEVWYEIVNNEPADWFSAANLPILTSYCRHVVSSNHIDQLIKEFEKEAKDNVDEETGKTKMSMGAYDTLLKMQARESAIIIAIATKLRFTHTSLRNDNGNQTKRKTTRKQPWD